MAQFVKKLQSSVRTVNLMMLLVLVNPIIKMVQAMNQLAAGNFTVRLAPAARGYEPNEIREFKAVFNWMKICRKTQGNGLGLAMAKNSRSARR